MTCPKCGASLTVLGRDEPSPPRDPLIGRTLGEFEVLEPIGRGGMGAVCKGRQPTLGRVVAIKTLPRGLALDKNFVTRSHREARTAARLHHANIVQVYAVGEAEGPSSQAATTSSPLR